MFLLQYLYKMYLCFLLKKMINLNREYYIQHFLFYKILNIYISLFEMVYFSLHKNFL